MRHTENQKILSGRFSPKIILRDVADPKTAIKTTTEIIVKLRTEHVIKHEMPDKAGLIDVRRTAVPDGLQTGNFTI